MCDRVLTKLKVGVLALMSLSMISLFAQELPESDDSFDIEPPLLIPPSEMERGADDSPVEASEAQPDAAKLEQQLERAKKSAASAERLVKAGVLAKTEAEQRTLRAVRLASELAKARLIAAQEQVTLQKARLAAGQASQAKVDAATAALARANAAAQTAEESYDKAQLDDAALNLQRQRRLLALGSAHKSDVARAEEKLARLEGGDQMSR